MFFLSVASRDTSGEHVGFLYRRSSSQALSVVICISITGDSLLTCGLCALVWLIGFLPVTLNQFALSPLSFLSHLFSVLSFPSANPVFQPLPSQHSTKKDHLLWALLLDLKMLTVSYRMCLNAHSLCVLSSFYYSYHSPCFFIIHHDLVWLCPFEG